MSLPQNKVSIDILLLQLSRVHFSYFHNVIPVTDDFDDAYFIKPAYNNIPLIYTCGECHTVSYINT